MTLSENKTSCGQEKACSPDVNKAARGDELSLLHEEDKTFTGGPMVFALVHKRLCALNARALCKMLNNHITRLSLQKIEGEDVGKMTRQLRCITRQLKRRSRSRFILPPTYYEDIFTTISWEKFNSIYTKIKPLAPCRKWRISHIICRAPNF